MHLNFDQPLAGLQSGFSAWSRASDWSELVWIERKVLGCVQAIAVKLGKILASLAARSWSSDVLDARAEADSLPLEAPSVDLLGAEQTVGTRVWLQRVLGDGEGGLLSLLLAAQGGARAKAALETLGFGGGWLGSQVCARRKGSTRLVWGRVRTTLGGD